MKQLRDLRQTFLIFTEGETEEGYFKQFKVRCKTVNGGHALKILEEAIVQKKNLKRSYDQYWVVIDKDNSGIEDFLKAIQLAERKKCVLPIVAMRLRFGGYFISCKSKCTLILKITNARSGSISRNIL